MRPGATVIGAIVVIACGTLLGHHLWPVRSQMQPRVAFVFERYDSLTSTQISSSCPQVAIADNFFQPDASREADYRVLLGWANGRWESRTTRADDTVITDVIENNDYTKVLRPACGAIAKDAPRWVSDQLFRSQLRLSSSRANSAGAVAESDPIRRYQLTEYRHGNIVGVALLDTELGRAWRLTDVGKDGTQFKEVTVQGLWESQDDEWTDEHTAFGAGPGDFEQTMKFNRALDEVKQLTRPKAVQQAERKANEGVLQ